MGLLLKFAIKVNSLVPALKTGLPIELPVTEALIYPAGVHCGVIELLPDVIPKAMEMAGDPVNAVCGVMITS